jgi:hypothetical protein
VNCTATNRAFLARSCDLRPYRSDLDGALVETEASVVGRVHDLLVANQPWSSALVARALTNVDMARPGAMAAAHLLAHGRRPGTLNSYEGKFDRFFRLGLDTPSVPTIRACACLVVQFLWFARADTASGN